MKIQDIHTLIIPDIHGRTFWKEALEIFPKESFPNLSIVFLGDYLDPYETIEYITRKQAIDNFKEIIKTTKKDNRIHLLFGNHDMHYWYNAQYKSRVDHKNYEKIKDLFLKNFTLFNVAYEEIVNNEKYLYTHAGVTKFWLDHLKFIGKISCENNKVEYIDRLGQKRKKVSDEQLPFCEMLRDMTYDAEKLNKMKLNFQGEANLWCVSWYRGGDSDSGSCIWADFNEWAYENSNDNGPWQIFGHSLAAGGFDEGIVNFDKKIAMLDSRQAWVLYNNGNLCKLSDID